MWETQSGPNPGYHGYRTYKMESGSNVWTGQTSWTVQTGRTSRTGWTGLCVDSQTGCSLSVSQSLVQDSMIQFKS